MLKLFSLGIISLFSTHAVETNTSTPIANEDFCRVTCTINVPDGFGGSIGISGTAGNFLTSCESAREKACKRAFENTMDIMMDM